MDESSENCKCCGHRHANVDETRKAIMFAALEEFALRSVDGARTREIAKKANVNHAAINYHFGSKEEMYRRIIEESVAHFEEAYAPLISEVGEFLKTDGKNSAHAISLIKKILIFHHSFFYLPDFSKFFLLFKREELFPSLGFETIFKKTCKPFYENFLKLVEVASKFKYSKKQSSMIVIALMNLNGGLTASRVPFLKMNKQDAITQKDIDIFCDITSLAIDKIFAD